MVQKVHGWQCRKGAGIDTLGGASKLRDLTGGGSRAEFTL
jgi:hypothetical protein